MISRFIPVRRRINRISYVIGRVDIDRLYDMYTAGSEGLDDEQTRAYHAGVEMALCKQAGDIAGLMKAMTIYDDAVGDL